MSLTKKQERKNSEGKYIGFKNGLSLNKEIENTEKWSEQEIIDRTEFLVKKAIVIFKL